MRFFSFIIFNIENMDLKRNPVEFLMYRGGKGWIVQIDKVPE